MDCDPRSCSSLFDDCNYLLCAWTLIFVLIPAGRIMRTTPFAFFTLHKYVWTRSIKNVWFRLMECFRKMSVTSYTRLLPSTQEFLPTRLQSFPKSFHLCLLESHLVPTQLQPQFVTKRVLHRQQASRFQSARCGHRVQLD